MLEQYLATHEKPADLEFYLCGPPAMVKTCYKILESLGVPEEHISFDEF